jgi:hypothetical protein
VQYLYYRTFTVEFVKFTQAADTLCHPSKYSLVLKNLTMSALPRRVCYCRDIDINSLRRLGAGCKFLVAAMQIADWLNALGLGRYAGTFAENGVDELSILRHLTDQDLGEARRPARAQTQDARSNR